MKRPVIVVRATSVLNIIVDSREVYCKECVFYVDCKECVFYVDCKRVWGLGESK